MCGLIGRISTSDVVASAVDSLADVEYRGYDSHGLAVYDSGEITIRKNLGLITLEAKKKLVDSVKGKVCIAHTRWATHGVVSLVNAHPIISFDKSIAITHNGIISNFKELQNRLSKEGVAFATDTDSEVVAHLFALNSLGADSALEAFATTVSQLEGEYSILALSLEEMDCIFAATKGSPLLWSVGDFGVILASDENAVSKFSTQGYVGRDGDILVARCDGVDVWTLGENGLIRNQPVSEVFDEHVPINKSSADKHMFFEISEIPKAISSASEAAVRYCMGNCEELSRSDIFITGAGGSYFQTLLGKQYFSRIAKLNVHACRADELISSFNLSTDSHLISLTQSGETYDTIEAIKWAVSCDAKTTVVTNIKNSRCTRLALHTIFQESGREIAVPSTKTTIGQAVTLYVIAVQIAHEREALSAAGCKLAMDAMLVYPDRLTEIMRQITPGIQRMAANISKYEHLLVIGQGYYSPVADEVALKIKEVCYLHAESVPLGMVKHGVLAMIDENVPTLVIGASDQENLLQSSPSISQINARNGVLYGMICSNKSLKTDGFVDLVVIPEISEYLNPITLIVAGQLLTYFIGHALGRPIDRPRNLAKSVTVK